MSRHLDTQLVTERHDGFQPGLPQLIVGHPLELELELCVVMLLLIRHPEPLDAHGEHPIHRGLHHVTGFPAGLAQTPHPHLAVTEVEVLLHAHLDESALQRPVARVPMHVAEKRDAGPVVQAVGRHELRPVHQRLVEAVWVLELLRRPLVQQLIPVHPEVLEEPVGDVRMAQLILDDRRGRDHRVGRGRVLRGHVVRGGAHELGITLYRQLADQRLLVRIGHVGFGFDDEAFLHLSHQLVVGEPRHPDLLIVRRPLISCGERQSTAEALTLKAGRKRAARARNLTFRP